VRLQSQRTRLNLLKILLKLIYWSHSQTRKNTKHVPIPGGAITGTLGDAHFLVVTRFLLFKQREFGQFLFSVKSLKLLPADVRF